MADQKFGGVPLRCSFFGASQDAVQKLIVGPNVSICEQCVRSWVTILTEDGMWRER